MASGFIGNEVPRKGLRVRIPCPPPSESRKSLLSKGLRLFFYFNLALLGSKHCDWMHAGYARPTATC